jgi:hypothetical protein
MKNEKFSSFSVKDIPLFGRELIPFCNGINVFLSSPENKMLCLFYMLQSAIQTTLEGKDVRESLPTKNALREIIPTPFKEEVVIIAIEYAPGSKDLPVLPDVPVVCATQMPGITAARTICLNPVMFTIVGFEFKRVIDTNTGFAFNDHAIPGPRLTELDDWAEKNMPKIDKLYSFGRIMFDKGLKVLWALNKIIEQNWFQYHTILVWATPEEGIHPKHLKLIAELLILLEKLDIQIFITTHSLFLIKEMEILKQKDTTVVYYGLESGPDGQLKWGPDYELQPDLSLLDEELQQDDRFLNIPEPGEEQ